MAIFNLNKKLLRLDKKEYRENKNKRKTWLIRGMVALVIIIVAIYLPIRGIYASARQSMSSAKLIMAGAKQEDLTLMKKGIVETRSSVSSLNTSLNFLFWVGLIPFVGGYYNDAKHLTAAAKYELEAAEIIIDSLEPFKQELGLVGQPTPGQDKVAQGVKVLDKVIPNLDKIEPSLKKARKEVEPINVDKYPGSFGSTPIKSRVGLVKDSIIGIDEAVSENRPLIEMAPSALGYPSSKSYLLLFQNDKEIRATGGFMTAYAFLALDRGRLNTPASDDIYHLDERLLKSCQTVICPLTPPAPIVKYLPEFDGKPRKAWSLRDSNLSPDFFVSMGDFENIYKFVKDGERYDGVIAIDTKVVEELIKLTGPIDVFGTVYSAETDKRCDCPNVIYELEHYAQIASKGEADRKAVLGTLMQQILVKSLGTGTDRLPDFLTTAIKLANDKHVLFYMHDQKLQESLAKLNWTGEIKKVEGDFLHINDSNFAGGKSNLYVTEKVTYEISVDREGNAKNKVTIEYKNPQPFSIWLNGILRDYVRIYVPSGSKLTNSKGSDDPVKDNKDETLDKSYFEAFITVRPQNSRVLSFEYTLPNKVSGKSYPLLIQKQPGSKDHRYIIKVNGRNQAEFDLTSDKQLNLPL